MMVMMKMMMKTMTTNGNMYALVFFWQGAVRDAATAREPNDRLRWILEAWSGTNGLGHASHEARQADGVWKPGARR